MNHNTRFGNNSSPAKKGSILPTLLLLTGYLLLAVLLTWPTAGHLATHLPGDGGDDPAIAWNLWWVKYALLNRAQSPFYTDYLFYPVGVNLAFYTLTVWNAVTALPITLTVNVVTASNLHMFFSFATGAYGTFLLVRYVLTPTLPSAGRLDIGPNRLTPARNLIWLSAAISGGFNAFASSNLFYVSLGQFNIASTHWIPFAVLYTLRTRRQPRQLKNPLIAALFLTMQTWSEMTYASFLLIFIGLYWTYWLIENGVRYIRREETDFFLFRWHLRNLAVTGAAFGLGIRPILAHMLPDMQIEGDFLVEGSGFAETFSADLLGFFVPTLHHPWFGHLVTFTDITAYDKGQHIYLGFILIGLLAITTAVGFRIPELRFWLIATAIFALLALGPIITINGQSTAIPGPFVIFQHLPFFKGNRYPSRYSVMLILSLAPVAGFGLAWIGSKLLQSKSSVWSFTALVLIGALFLFEHLSIPLPQSDMRPPPLYQRIAAGAANGTLLDIPFAWRNGFRITGPLTTQFMFGQFYQTVHQKRLLQGNTSRNPAFKFQYFTEAPVINSLLALETGREIPPEQRAVDQAIAAEVLRFFDIDHIVVRPYSYQRFNGVQIETVTQETVIPYIEAVLPVEKIYEQAKTRVYRVDREDGYRPNLPIETGLPLAPLYFGEGWGLLTPGLPVTAQRESVRLLLPLSPEAQQLTLRIRLPDAVSAEARSLSISANGWQSLPQTVTQTWQEVTFTVPANVVEPGLNDVYLHFDAVAPTPPPAPDHPILDVTVLSAGEEVGSFGHIFVNGYDVSPNERGYNIAVIQPGQPIISASFDTHLDPSAAARLADFLASPGTMWEPGAIVAVAAADEVSNLLNQEAVSALQSTGAGDDLRGCFRCSHALIYEAGLAENKIVEASSAIRPVGLTTGLGLTEPHIAAIVEWIYVETNSVGGITP